MPNISARAMNSILSGEEYAELAASSAIRKLMMIAETLTSGRFGVRTVLTRTIPGTHETFVTA